MSLADRMIELAAETAASNASKPADERVAVVCRTLGKNHSKESQIIIREVMIALREFCGEDAVDTFLRKRAKSMNEELAGTHPQFFERLIANNNAFQVWQAMAEELGDP